MSGKNVSTTIRYSYDMALAWTYHYFYLIIRILTDNTDLWSNLICLLKHKAYSSDPFKSPTHPKIKIFNPATL